MISIQGGLSELFSKNYSGEADLNIWALPSNSTLNYFAPKAPVCWLLGIRRPYWLVRRGHSSSTQTQSPGNCELGHWPEEISIFRQERANLNPDALCSARGSAPTYQTASS